MSVRSGGSSDGLHDRKLDSHPPQGFECGRADQNSFLYETAWEDQNASLSTTYLFYLDGMVAAYATVLMDSILLGRKERVGIRYRNVSSLKLGQLGVDLHFPGHGIGQQTVAYTLDLARDVSERVACRYVTLDAQPDLVTWYERLGFQMNQARQAERVADAVRHRRDPDGIAISMRFDLRDRGPAPSIDPVSGDPENTG